MKPRRRRGRPGRIRQSQRGHLAYLCAKDPLRAVLGGGGLGMVVALQYFDAADWQKGLLGAALTGGMLFSPLCTLLVARLQWTASRATAGLTWAATLGLVTAAFAINLEMFFIGLISTGLMIAVTIPLVTDIWRQNAPASIRGRLFGFNMMVSSAFSLGASLVVAAWMGDDPGRFRPVFLMLAGLLALSGWACWRIPSRPLPVTRVRNPVACLALIWKSPLFGYMSFVWYLIGFANLATLPLRVEFAGSTERGLGLSPGMVLMVTVVLPESMRFVSLSFWARLFDRMNFILLRMVINSCFLVSIALFFRESMVAMVVGSLFLGLGMGGGNIAWNLWVTKFCPPEQTADFMAAHTFLTGTRGALGPQLAFLVLGAWGIGKVVDVASVMLVLSIVLLLPIVGHGNRTSDGKRRLT